MKKPLDEIVTWPLSVLLLICFASAILGDSTAEALLLSHFDAKIIPRMFSINAVLLFISSALMMSIIDRVNRAVLFVVFLWGHGAVLLLIKFATQVGLDMLYLPLFSYAYITKIVVFLLFWTLANDLIDSRKAGTKFPLIAAGGTLGAIVVSFTIPGLMKFIKAENLLLIWAVLVIVLGFLFLPLYYYFGRQFRSSSDRQKHQTRSLKTILNDLVMIRSEPLLWNMSILYFMLFFLLLNQHYTFYSQVRLQFTSAEQIASFLGFFTGISMFTTFLIQISVSGFINRKIGSTRAMLLLPAALCIGFATLTVLSFFNGMSVGAFFWAVVLGMGLRIAFFDSFFSPNFQVFFSSLPQEVRGRGKLSIEGVVKPVAMIFASMWLIFIAPRLGIKISVVLLLLLSILAILQTLHLRSKYTESLTRYLSGISLKKSVFIEQFNLSGEQNVLNILEAMLKDGDFEIKRFAIDLLASTNTSDSITLLLEYLYSPDGRIRATIVASIGALHRADLKPVLIQCLLDTDDRVIANTVTALTPFGEPDVIERLEPFLYHPASRIRANTIMMIWPHVGKERQIQLAVQLHEMMYAGTREECSGALYALGEIKDPDAIRILMEFGNLLKEKIFQEPMVWRQYTRAIAKKKSELSIRLLLSLCPDANRKKKEEISTAISTMILNGFDPQIILGMVTAGNLVDREILISALLLSQLSLTKEQEAPFKAMIYEELYLINQDRIALIALEKMIDIDSVRLLSFAVNEEHISARKQMLIQAASMIDKSGKIRKIIPRLSHTNRHIRARAFEVFDNTGDLKINRSIIRILDNDESILKDQASPGNPAMNLFDAVKYCQGSVNGWVKRCAGYTAFCIAATSDEYDWESLIAKV